MRLLNSEIEKRIEVKLDKTFKNEKSSGIMTFGSDNDYPQKIEKLVAGSQTAKSARDVYAKFIAGSGFNNPNIGEIVVGSDPKGKPVTLDKIRRQVGRSAALNSGSYIHANVSASGVVGNTRIVPFKNCRVSTEDDSGNTGSILVYDNWDKSKSKKITKNDIASYYNFNIKPTVIMSNIKDAGGADKFQGQIYSLSFDDEFLYPLSPFDPVYLDCDTEYQIQLFKNRQVRDGFAKKAILLFDMSDDEKEREKLVEKARGWTGPDGENLLILEAEFNEETGELADGSLFKTEIIDSNIDDKMFENWEKNLSNSIRKAVKALPAVLIDYEQGQLSQASGEMIELAVRYFNALTQSEREAMEEMFKDIYKNFDNDILRKNEDWSIKPFDMFEAKEVDDGTAT
jgi:hypothetical protein